VTLSPANLTFTGQTVGSTSPSQTVTLTNTGSAALAVSGVSINDDFAQTNTCGTSVAAGGSCTIKVTFTPTSSGSHSGTLSINDSAPGSPHTVLLAGAASGGTSGPLAVLSATSLAYGALAVGVTSGAQSVTVTNNGKGTLNIVSILTDGDYAETDTCGYSLAAGTTCTISVKFTPSALGTRPGRITINDDAANSPQTINLSGSGGIGQITWSPGNLTFVTQTVGTTSDAQTVTITNAGTIPVTISSITLTGGDFAQTNTCTDPVTASGTCTINVTFTPTTTGFRAGQIVIVDDAPGSPHSFVLNGTGGS
jgi:hypothetical protein